MIARFASILLVAALAAGSVQAQDSSLRAHPGFIDFDLIPETINVEPNIEVYLKGALLRLAAEATRFEDPELADMLLDIKAIRVFGFEPERRRWDDDLGDSFRETSRILADRLEDAGWDMVARVRDDDELVYVYVRDIDEKIEGMTVIVIDDNDEAVFVNIVGTIDPAQIGKLGHRFDIDVLDDIDY